MLNTVNSSIAQTSLNSFRLRDINCHKQQQEKPTVGEAYSKLSTVKKCRFSNMYLCNSLVISFIIINISLVIVFFFPEILEVIVCVLWNMEKLPNLWGYIRIPAMIPICILVFTHCPPVLRFPFETARNQP